MGGCRVAASLLAVFGLVTVLVASLTVPAGSGVSFVALVACRSWLVLSLLGLAGVVRVDLVWLRALL